jgi:hypothetical protein
MPDIALKLVLFGICPKGDVRVGLRPARTKDSISGFLYCVRQGEKPPNNRMFFYCGGTYTAVAPRPVLGFNMQTTRGGYLRKLCIKSWIYVRDGRFQHTHLCIRL